MRTARACMQYSCYLQCLSLFVHVLIHKQPHSLTSCADSTFFQVLSGVDLSSCCPAFCSAMHTVVLVNLLAGELMGAAGCRGCFFSTEGPETVGLVAKQARRGRACTDLQTVVVVERVVKAQAHMLAGCFFDILWFCPTDR